MCMTFIAGRAASVTGRVMVAHNEDDTGCVAVRHGYVPAADWPEGTLLPAEPGCAAIPQVAHTHGYYWSEVRGAEGGFSTSDSFYNDCGVLVTSNSCMRSRENLDDPDRLTQGGISYNLRRAVAERASTARDGLKILIELVTSWGYAPSARAYTVADSREAFMVQIASGRHYMAARIPDGHVCVMPNHYTLHGLNDLPEMYYPDDLVSYAIERGWYVPAVDGCYDDFDFARAYQAPELLMHPENTLRHRHSLQMLLGRHWEAETLPFSVPAPEPVTRERLMDMLSNHYAGTDDDLRIGPGRSPHDTANRRVCTATTVESFVCEFDVDPRLTTLWTAFGRPCQQPWLPLHPLCGLPREVQVMEDPAGEMARHLLPDPNAVSWQDSGWQRFRDFGNALEMVYADTIDAVQAQNHALYVQAVRENDAAVASARATKACGQSDATRMLLRDVAQRQTSAALNALQELAQTHFRQAVVHTSGPVPLRRDGVCTLSFTCPVCPVESSLRLGVCRETDHSQYACCVPGSLVNEGDGLYRADFPANPIHARTAPGIHECFLGGASADATPFTGTLQVLIVS